MMNFDLECLIKYFKMNRKDFEVKILFCTVLYLQDLRVIVLHFIKYLGFMEVEYSGGGVLIFSYLILMHLFDNFGGLR